MEAHRLAAAALAAALSATPPLAAQRPASADTLLSRLTAEALAANPGLGILDGRARAAGARARAAGALPDPGLSLTAMDLTLPHLRFRESDFTEVDVEARQEFPWPGTLGARSRAAVAAFQGRKADVAAGRREVVVTTAELYHRLRYLAGAREVLRSQRSLLDRSLEIATARYATGSAPQSDPLSARAARARLGIEEAKLAAEETSIRAKLRALRGRVDPESLAVTPLHPEEVLALYPTLAAHPHGDVGSLARHPRVLVRQAAIASAEETARAEALGARPDFELMARYGARPIASDFLSVGVGLRLPLWAGRKQKLLARAERDEAEAERAALAEEQRTLAAEFEAAVAEATAGQEQLRLLLEEVIPSAEAGREAALRGYGLGQVDFQSVLDAEERVYRARLDAADVSTRHLTHLVMLEELTREEELP